MTDNNSKRLAARLGIGADHDEDAPSEDRDTADEVADNLFWSAAL